MMLADFGPLVVLEVLAPARGCITGWCSFLHFRVLGHTVTVPRSADGSADGKAPGRSSSGPATAPGLSLADLLPYLARCTARGPPIRSAERRGPLPDLCRLANPKPTRRLVRRVF